jgi:proteasome lid subunit RPN8/RPN11
MMASPAENQQATWSAPQCPFAICYDVRVLDDVRLAVTDAFFSLPRGGAEIGGLLLGTYDGQQVLISGYAALEMEHAFGPSFTLSPRDEAQLAELISRHQGQVVGWYHSHTRSEIFFPEADQGIHNRFFTEPWQVALVLKPHTFQPMRGGFFFREGAGAIHGEATYREFSLAPLPLRAVPSEDAPVEPARNRVDPKFTGPVIEIEAAGAEPEEPPERVPEPAQAAPSWIQEDVAAFAAPPAQKSRRWWVAGLCVLLASAMCVWVYQMRNLWLPAVTSSAKTTPAATAPPPAVHSDIGLTVTEKEKELHIRWDRNSPTVRNAVSGFLSIIDGDVSRTVSLDQDHLQSGSVIYIRKAEAVDLSLTLQPANGPPLKEAAQFHGKLPGDGQDQQLIQRLGDLVVQNDRLKNDLAHQTERARKAEKALEELQKASQRKRLANQVPDIVK